MKISELDYAKLFDEVEQEIQPPPDEYFSIAMFEERLGITRSKASGQIKRLIDEGRVDEVRKYLVNNNWTMYYKRIK